MKENAIIWFDATCLLCNRSVQFILQRDPDGFFLLGTVQQKSKDSYGTNPDSIMLEQDGKIFTRSTAVLLILKQLNTPLRHLHWLIWIPRPMRDLIYRIIAKNRYRWFGRTESCNLFEGKYADRFIGKPS
jgi:predicted DCC family thiol-disulfide oxidoreductase YuxK